MSLHPKLVAMGRQMLKDLLAQCDEKQQEIFKLMYARNNGKRSVEEAKAVPINQVVDELDPDKISWALVQVERTVDKNEARKQSNPQ
jgi:phage terminase large subunit-like protein